jgi:hypothetical protein
MPLVFSRVLARLLISCECSLLTDAMVYVQLLNLAAMSRRSTEGESVQSGMLNAPPSLMAVIDRYISNHPSCDRRSEKRDECMVRSSAPKGRR